ncbi:Polypyrimidine tract-binding protein-like protein 3 [Forsythia ovata]|uniref:Polypyrimidine tract-binding protein-like protein 3 n=1 Tax=Forsythia ovata TaxID=205694 RepID=A0ABD1SL60_9LAMI
MSFPYRGPCCLGSAWRSIFQSIQTLRPELTPTEYSNSNLNRFNRNAAKNYRYCCSPTKMIHISTLPQDVTEEEIVAHLEEHGTIVSTKLFEMNGKKQALVLFEN